MMVEPHPPHEIDPAASDAWLVTFSDLLALMLTFFVLVFSMSQIRLDAWESMVEAMTDRLSPREEWREIRLVQEPQAEHVHRAGAVELGYLEAVLTEKLRADPLLGDAVLHRLDDRIILSLPGDQMFAPGRAELRPEARRAVVLLADALRFIANQVEIEGHSVPEGEGAATETAAWGLSLARALEIADVVSSEGKVDHLRASGLGSARFYEISPRLDTRRRLRLGDRVDLVVLRDAPMEASGNG